MGSAGCVVDEEVVGGDVEGLGEADDGVGGGGDSAVFVSADLGGVGSDVLGEVGLGPGVFGSELFDAFGEGHEWCSVFGLSEPFCGHLCLLCCRVGLPGHV